MHISMIPMRTTTVFKSRWMALIYAAGVVWAAYDFAGSKTDDDAAPDVNATSNMTDGQSLAQLDNSVGVAQAQ